MTIQTVTTEYGTSYLQCTCDQTAIRRRIQSNGVAIFVRQCLSCGRQIQAVKKDSAEVRRLADVQPFDDTLQRAWRERQRQSWELQNRTREAQREQESTEWWRAYNAYLQTTAWRLKRQAVLTRANNWCEGCGVRPATQVHHKTYDHVGRELLFELVAVCNECHHVLHPDMDD